MKKQNLLITSALASVLAFPAMADIAANAPSAKCDNGTLETYQGESTLQAQWDANTINLKWYTDSSDNNGTEITPTNNAAATCTYDDAIVLPTNTISKPGYEFAGWRVRAAAAPSQPQQTTFDLSTLNASTSGIDYSSKNFAGDYCYYYNDDTEDEIDSETCNESAFTGLSTGEWKVNFSYGTVKGEARCSTTPGSNGWFTNGTYDNNGNWSNTTKLASLTDQTGQEGARYCWCKPTGFDAEGDGTYLNVSSSSWVFAHALGDSARCADYCAGNCGNDVRNDADFRSIVFRASAN